MKLAGDDEKRAIGLQFPSKIILQNNSKNDNTFLRMYYSYNDNIPIERKGGFGIGLYQYNNSVLNKVRNKKTTIKSKNKLSYIYYTMHYINSNQSTKLEEYIKDMNIQNKDTLHIGTVTEFKKNHKELFEKLTKNDSISIQFLDGKKLGQWVIVPVKW